MAKIKWHATIGRTLQADEEALINRSGRRIVVVEATAAFKISVDDEPFVEIEKSFELELQPGEEFQRVRIRNDGASPNTIKLQIGFTNLTDRRLGVSGGISLSGAGTVTTVADVSLVTVATTIISAANSNRRRIHITNLDTTAILRIGDSNAGAARGIELPPGETLPLETSAAVYGYNPAGASVLVGVLELEN